MNASGYETHAYTTTNHLYVCVYKYINYNGVCTVLYTHNLRAHRWRRSGMEEVNPFSAGGPNVVPPPQHTFAVRN